MNRHKIVCDQVNDARFNDCSHTHLDGISSCCAICLLLRSSDSKAGKHNFRTFRPLSLLFLACSLSFIFLYVPCFQGSLRAYFVLCFVFPTWLPSNHCKMEKQTLQYYSISQWYNTRRWSSILVNKSSRIVTLRSISN